MNRSDWIILILLSILWGGSFFFVEVAVAALPPFTLVLCRVALAALALWGFVLVRGIEVPKNLTIWTAFIGMGLINNVIPFSLLTWGQTELSAGYAAILNATTPVFTVIVASMFLADEKATKGKVIGVLISFSGVIVMVGPSALSGLGANLLAQLAILGAATSYAFAGVFGRKFQKFGLHPVLTATGQVTGSTLVLAPLVWWLDNPAGLVMPGFEVIGSVAALALLSTALAYILYFRLLKTAGATNMSLVTFLVPISAIWLGVTILGETISEGQIAGMALIGLGLLAIDGRLARRLVRTPRP